MTLKDLLLKDAGPVAEAASAICEAAINYGELYSEILAKLPNNPAACFHAKNIANTLEPHFFAGPALECKKNGLGPGFEMWLS